MKYPFPKFSTAHFQKELKDVWKNKNKIKSYTNSTNTEKNSHIQLNVIIKISPWFWLTEYI